MSNNYNLTLQSNNTTLQSILDKINKLPNASDGSINLQDKTIMPSSNQQTIIPDNGYDGLSTVTINGDDDLVSENIKSGINIFGIVGTYDGRSANEDTSIEDELVARTITDYTNINATNVGSYAFYKYNNLSMINLPNCTTIGSNAFAECSGLNTINLPNCTTIGSNAFSECISLNTINLPNCTTISSNAFYSCINLLTVDLPNCVTVGQSAFRLCYNLSTISLPNCTTINGDAFNHCSSLTTISLPNCTTIGEHAFAACDNLTTISLPNCTTINDGAFNHCSSLTTISLPNCTTIGDWAFHSCNTLKSLYLMGSIICNLLGSDALRATQIFGQYEKPLGSIYVPASLLTSYKNATNWVYYSSRFVGI